MIKATVICDSVFNGNRITTFELEYQRFIHSELMTHRVFSRNAMSSRAIPIEKMIEQVAEVPAMPVQWGLNQAGMQANTTHEDTQKCINTWRNCAYEAVKAVKGLQELGLHKQIANRPLEPFQWMKTIVTATEWDNFFELRTHKDAQPEFQVLAKLMKEGYEKSTPQELQEGMWHLPYIRAEVEKDSNCNDVWYLLDNTPIKEEVAIKISASCCAQVSYRKNDTSIKKAINIYERLVTAEPPHFSPFEHQAKAFSKSYPISTSLKLNCKGITHFDLDGNYWSGNFKNWIQYRQLL